MHDTGWVDREAYPFEAHYFESNDGRMHYIDEGQGKPIVMVHGTTTWSFLYRHLVKALSPHYRCIALDHLGYGLSDKPQGAPYRVADHARRFHAFIEHLDLDDFTLIVHDYGGPIGLSYAIDRPDAVRAIVLFNTWLWSLRGEAVAEIARISGGGRLGEFVFQKLNFEMQVLFKSVWGKPTNLSRSLHNQYLKPFPEANDREAITWLARELRGADTWYEELWSKRERIKEIPALLLWGLKDPIFKAQQLARWQALFTNAQTITFPTAGHYVQEEESGESVRLVQAFLASTPYHQP